VFLAHIGEGRSDQCGERGRANENGKKRQLMMMNIGRNGIVIKL